MKKTPQEKYKAAVARIDISLKQHTLELDDVDAAFAALEEQETIIAKKLEVHEELILRLCKCTKGIVFSKKEMLTPSKSSRVGKDRLYSMLKELATHAIENQSDRKLKHKTNAQIIKECATSTFSSKSE